MTLNHLGMDNFGRLQFISNMEHHTLGAELSLYKRTGRTELWFESRHTFSDYRKTDVEFPQRVLGANGKIRSRLPLV